jgi:HlyD family secretion protein
LRAGLTGTATLPSLAFDERFEVRLDVDEIDVVLVEVGQRVDLEVDALRGTALQGTIVAIGRAPERAATGGTVYRTRVRLDTPDEELPLRGGLTGTADVEVRRLVGELTVPSTALLRRGGGEVVYVVRDGVAVEVPVRVLAFGETRVAITVDGDALRAGDRVVTTGLERVTAGAVVEVG